MKIYCAKRNGMSIVCIIKEKIERQATAPWERLG